MSVSQRFLNGGKAIGGLLILFVQVIRFLLIHFANDEAELEWMMTASSAND